MAFCKDGKYVKYLKGSSDDTILAFVAKTEEDNYFKILQMIREKEKEIGGFQCCEDKEELNNFKRVFVLYYNIYGQPVKDKKGIIVDFDFDNEVIYINDKKFKVKEDDKYAYKFQKTQIKAVDGIKGLYKHTVEAIHVESAFNGVFYTILEKCSV